MTVIVLTADGKKITLETVSGPSSYTTGGFPVTFRDLTNVQHILSARANTGVIAEGYIPAASGNLASVRVYWQTGASGTPMTEVASGANLSSITFTVVGLGY